MLLTNLEAARAPVLNTIVASAVRELGVVIAIRPAPARWHRLPTNSRRIRSLCFAETLKIDRPEPVVRAAQVWLANL